MSAKAHSVLCYCRIGGGGWMECIGLIGMVRNGLQAGLLEVGVFEVGGVFQAEAEEAVEGDVG